MSENRQPTVLVATWADGLFVLAGDSQRHELPGKPIRGLEPKDGGACFAIRDGQAVCLREHDGRWQTLATTEHPLACLVKSGDALYIGTDEAHLLRLGLQESTLVPLDGFDAVQGRPRWYAGSAVIDGQVVGPPLGVRSIAATCDSAVLLANVHVGGIPRSADHGRTWHPTVDIDWDIHEVCAHPARPWMLAAAGASGLCMSRDGGATWSVEQKGLHAPYCSAVAFSGNDVFVAASADHFAIEGAVYRRSIDDDAPLARIAGGGLPAWLDGIVDTACLFSNGRDVAIADQGGNVYLSGDNGCTWARLAQGLPAPSAVLVV